MRIDIYRRKRGIGRLCLSKSESMRQDRENGDRK